MRRRDFIILLGGSAAAWPLAARAQKATVPVVGYLSGGLPGPNAPWIAAFHKGLSEIGFIEGQNVTVEYRWADNQYARLPTLAHGASAPGGDCKKGGGKRWSRLADPTTSAIR